MKTMKSFVLPLGLVYVTLGSAAYAAAGETPRVNRVQMEIAEKGLDATLQRFTSDNTRTVRSRSLVCSRTMEMLKELRYSTSSLPVRS